MNILIVGYGSIGQRHARLLAPFARELAVISAQNVTQFRTFATLNDALSAFKPDYIVICTATFAHNDALNTLKTHDFCGQTLVEKPLFAHENQDKSPYPFPIFVAYQLRFHAVITALKNALKNRAALSAHIYVGQHLSGWRPGRDAKTTYSASRAQGGGVLRDLSHELDLISYLFGPITVAHTIGGKTSNVTLDSEDAVAMALSCCNCQVISLQMNYLDHVPRREWIVNTADTSIKADLIAKTIAINNEVISIACESDDAYLALHRAILDDNARGVCNFDEGLALVRLIDRVSLGLEECSDD